MPLNPSLSPKGGEKIISEKWYFGKSIIKVAKQLQRHHMILFLNSAYGPDMIVPAE